MNIIPKSHGCDLVDGVWWELTDNSYLPMTWQDLIPTEWPLNFHPEFILEVATNPALDSLGIYTNGWEL